MQKLKYLSESKNSLLRSDTASFKHDKVVGNFTIMRETSHRSYRLLISIIFSWSIVCYQFSILGMVSFSNTINFLVDFSSMMVTFLSSSCYSVLDTTWMPCTNTGDLTKTFVGLSWQFLTMPSGGYTWNIENYFQGKAYYKGQKVLHNKNKLLKFFITKMIFKMLQTHRTDFSLTKLVKDSRLSIFKRKEIHS